MRETELEMLQREKEAEHFKTWAEQEDNFHLHQAKLRSVCTTPAWSAFWGLVVRMFDSQPKGSGFNSKVYQVEKRKVSNK